MSRRVFVTGGAYGIGKSIVEAFAGRGDKVASWDIDAARGEVVAAQTGAAFYKVDVTDAAQLEAAMNTCSTHGATSTYWGTTWVSGCSSC